MTEDREPRCWQHFRKPDGTVGHCEGPIDHWGDCTEDWPEGPVTEDREPTDMSDYADPLMFQDYEDREHAGEGSGSVTDDLEDPDLERYLRYARGGD